MVRIGSIAARLAAVAVVAGTIVGLTAPGAFASIPTGNLLQNPDAEAGSCSNTTSPPEAIPDWTTTSSFTVVCYAAGVSQDSSSGAAISGGNNYFMGGVDATTTATQTIDVSSAATGIDAGGVQVNLSGYLGGYSSQGDNMVVTATFLGGSVTAASRARASSSQLGSMQIGPVTAADRNDTTEMLLRSRIAPVPSGTRSIQVTMTAMRTDGSDNDAAADNLSLSLTSGSATVTTGPAYWERGNGPPGGLYPYLLTGVVNPHGRIASWTIYAGRKVTSEVAVGHGTIDPTSADVTVTAHTPRAPAGETFYYHVTTSSGGSTVSGGDQTTGTTPHMTQTLALMDKATDRTSTGTLTFWTFYASTRQPYGTFASSHPISSCEFDFGVSDFAKSVPCVPNNTFGATSLKWKATPQNSLQGFHFLVGTTYQVRLVAVTSTSEHIQSTARSFNVPQMPAVSGSCAPRRTPKVTSTTAKLEFALTSGHKWTGQSHLSSTVTIPTTYDVTYLARHVATKTTSPQDVSNDVVHLTGLHANTTYRYTCTAHSANGTYKPTHGFSFTTSS